MRLMSINYHLLEVALNGKAILHLTEKQFASTLRNPSCHCFKLSFCFENKSYIESKRKHLYLH